MPSLKTFSRGGVHPPECKISAKMNIEVLHVPQKVSIPISQHLGAPSTPLVKRGDMVKVGTPVAKTSGFISANIHSSVSGKVANIAEVVDTSGYPRKAVVIDVDGDEWEESIDRGSDLKKDISLSRDEIVQKVLESGVVGLGGATFPTHVKLMVPQGKKAEILIINGVECEPYLTSDHRLMLERGEELLVGIRIIMTALETDKAVIGIEANKPDAIKYLTGLAKDYPGVSVQTLKVKYPQGGEKQLIKAITGREVPNKGGLPIDVGTVVHNVGTVLAIYEAVQKNRPLVERVVTITGKSVKKPGNYMVRIGTPVQDLVEAAGGITENSGKIISGGPMMGKTLTNLDVPVVKGTSGILIIPRDESKRKVEGNCIRCGKCVSVCPLGVEPHLLYALSKRGDWERAEKEDVMNCCECGSCQYTCPAHLPLLDYLRVGKAEVGKQIRARHNKK